MLQQSEADKTNGAAELVNQLPDVSLEIIKRPDGREVFEVYNWQAQDE